MLIITKITYRQDFVELLLDNEERLSMPLEAASQYRIVSGKQISQEEYSQLKEESNRYICKKKAVNYIAIRNRTSKEVEAYLKKKGFSSNIIEETLINLKSSKLINDLNYSIEYAESRMMKKAVGRNLIRRDLIKKGISKEFIKSAMEKIPPDTYDFERIYDLALKKYESVKNKHNSLNRVYSYLLGRGYEHDIAYKAIRNIKKQAQNLDEDITQ